jgi:SAM-dependent methyltransferase
MRLHTLAVAIPAALAALASQAAIDSPAFVQAPTIQEKRVITSADQLPRRQYQITKLPSELIDAPRAELDAAVNALDKDLEADLATLDIRDRAARTGMINSRAQIATYRGDYAAALAFVRDVRSQQEKAADKLTSGVTVENILAARIAGGPVDKQRALLKEIARCIKPGGLFVLAIYKTPFCGLWRVEKRFDAHASPWVQVAVLGCAEYVFR